MAKCLVRGSINADEYFHVKAIARPGETISSYNFQVKAGGKGANQAVAVAKAGGRVEFVGAVGESGGWLVDELVGYGVGVEGMVKVEEPTGRALIQVAEDGENSIVLHHGANHAALPPPPQSESSSFRHGGITHLLLQNEIPLKYTIEYLSSAHSQSIICIMNPSPTPLKEEIQSFPWKKLSWLVVNEGEASSLLSAALSQKPDASTNSQQQDQQAYHHHHHHRELPSSWPQHTPAITNAYSIAIQLASQPLFASKVNIICTLGPLGVMALIPSLPEPSIYLPAAKLREAAVDTTGAGDCFAGYLVAGLMELHQKNETVLNREDIIHVLKRCVQAAGICVQRRGTIDSIPTSEEVATLFGRDSLVL